MAKPLKSKDSGLASPKFDSSTLHRFIHLNTAHVFCTHFLDSGGYDVLPIPGVVLGQGPVGVVRLRGCAADIAGGDVSFR